jgi:AraC family transcriptional regulator of adaptative response/methylated-DNA-[protein]-cysteine methyltransferase
MIDEDFAWNAVSRRDAGQDGKFIYGVVTTGVFCRPSCPSRLPLRANVRFFSNAVEAERAGLRPCLRCRPSAVASADPNAARIRMAAEFIQANCDQNLSLVSMSKRAGLSPFHFQRSFKTVLGLTPRQFQEACRLRTLRKELRAGEDILQSIFASGFGSTSRVYERVDRRLGMTPAEYRGGGRDVAISHVTLTTGMGLLLIAATDRGICFVQFGESQSALTAALRAEYPGASIAPVEKPWPEQLAGWAKAIDEHLQGNQPHLDLPLDIRATAFQMKVWRYLQTIPYGEVQSYGEVARAIGQESAVRAVANACASNRVALLVPCHRVIRGTGELGGYRWGLERKRVLIDRERSVKASATPMSRGKKPIAPARRAR